MDKDNSSKAWGGAGVRLREAKWGTPIILLTIKKKKRSDGRNPEDTCEKIVPTRGII